MDEDSLDESSLDCVGSVVAPKEDEEEDEEDDGDDEDDEDDEVDEEEEDVSCASSSLFIGRSEVDGK